MRKLGRSLPLQEAYKWQLEHSVGWGVAFDLRQGVISRAGLQYNDLDGRPSIHGTLSGDLWDRDRARERQRA